MSFKIFFCLFVLFYHPAFGVELSQAKFLLHFNHGAHYHLFDRQPAEALILLEWKLDKMMNHENLGLRLKLHEVPFSFAGPHNQKLNGSLFISDQANQPIPFYKNDDSNLIWKKREAAGSIVRFPIVFFLPAHQLVAPGEYKSYLDLSLLTEDLKILVEQQAEFIVTVLPAQKIAIFNEEDTTEGANSLRLDFGTTKDNATRHFIVEVTANVPCDILCKSLNGGNMKLQAQFRKMHYSTIDMLYSLSFQGRHINLRNGNAFLLHHILPKTIQPIKYPIALTVQPDLQKNWEGTYEDEVLFFIRSAF